jgi:hypothetical protein
LHNFSFQSDADPCGETSGWLKGRGRWFEPKTIPDGDIGDFRDLRAPLSSDSDLHPANRLSLLRCSPVRSLQELRRLSASQFFLEKIFERNRI